MDQSGGYNRPASLRRLTSSGGVIFRNNEGVFEVALVSVRGGTIWCLPKGIVDRGETPEQTAVREVREETGLDGKILLKIDDINYWYYIRDENVKCRKTVHLYLMEYLSGNTDDHDGEVDSVEWMTLDEALRRISYRGDRSVLEKAKALITGTNG